VQHGRKGARCEEGGPRGAEYSSSGQALQKAEGGQHQSGTRAQTQRDGEVGGGARKKGGLLMRLGRKGEGGKGVRVVWVRGVTGKEQKNRQSGGERAGRIGREGWGGGESGGRRGGKRGRKEPESGETETQNSQRRRLLLVLCTWHLNA